MKIIIRFAWYDMKKKKSKHNIITFIIMKIILQNEYFSLAKIKAKFDSVN